MPGIFGMSPDGSNVRRLVPGVGLDPDFSPDGQSLLYVAPDANRHPNIFLTRLRGTPAQLTTSLPPLEYRQPEFLPSSTERALAYIATIRDIRTGAKEVRMIAAGSERTIAARASGASVQPRPPCVCRTVDAVIEPNSLDIISDSPEGVRMRGRIRWTLDCSLGAAKCGATFSIGTRRADLKFAFPNGTRGGVLGVSCEGPCARRTRGARTFQLVGGPATDVRSVTLRPNRSCNRSSLRPREFEIVFAADGRIDRARSDLNGDGKPDRRD